MWAKIKNFFSIEIDYKSRIYGFDIIRGLGVLVVVYAHARPKMHFFPRFNDFVSVLGFWIVDLFFVLSGFLIGMILIRFYEKETTFTLTTSYNFWIRRWFRTLPNYYFVLVITAVLWAVFEHNYIFLRPKFLLFLFFSQALITRPPYFIMEAWSLCIEEWFYLLFPLLLMAGQYLLSRMSPVKAPIKRNILAAAIVLFAVPNILRLLVFGRTTLEWEDLSRMTFFRFDTIAYGIGMAWINYYYKGTLEKYRKLSGYIAIPLTAAFLYYFYFILLPDMRSHVTTLFSFTLFFILSGTAALCVIMYLKEVKMGRFVRFEKFVTLMSLISYSIYIFHRSVVMYVIDKLFKARSDLDNVLLFVLYLVSTILFSMLVYKYFEHPVMQMRDRFNVKKK
jgi:peptidoglycan/LPS O-acetylase OafA/YrhL